MATSTRTKRRELEKNCYYEWLGDHGINASCKMTLFG